MDKESVRREIVGIIYREDAKTWEDRILDLVERESEKAYNQGRHDMMLESSGTIGFSSLNED